MVLVDLLPLLVSFLTLCVCVALLWAYKNTLGAVMLTLANALHGVSVLGVHPLDFLADGIHALDSTINAYLVQAVEGTEYAWAKVLQAHAVLWHDLTEAVGDLAGATQHWINNVSPRTITRIAAGVLAPYLGLLHWLTHEVAHLAALPAKVVTEVTHAVTVEVPKVITKVERISNTVVKTVTVTLPRTIPATFPRVGTLERDLKGIDQTIKDVWRKVSPAALAAVFATAVLTRMGMQWLRCSGVRNFNRGLCGIEKSVLDGLLAGLAIVFGTISLETFAKDLQGLVVGAEGEIAHFWRADVATASRNPGVGDSGL